MNDMGFLLHVSGFDRCGKSTLCDLLSKDLGADVTHFSNPKNIDDGKNQYFNFLNQISDDKIYICDRYHDGEWIYAPIYRGYKADYMGEIETAICNKMNYMFAFLTAEYETIIDRINECGEEFVKPKHFKQIMDSFVDDFLMEQRMPYTIINTTYKNKKESFEQVKHDMNVVDKIWSMYRTYVKASDEYKICFPLTLPRGNVRAKFMIIDQSPAVMDKSDYKFTTMFSHNNCKSNLIIDILKKAGVYLDCWFTNLVSYSINDNKINEHGSLHYIENLKLEIDLINPEKIFVLGEIASKYMKKYLPDIEFTTVHHPAYIQKFHCKNNDIFNEYINLFKNN